MKQYNCVCGRNFKSLQKLNAHTIICIENKHFIKTEVQQKRLGPINEIGFYSENQFCYRTNINGDNVVVQSNETHLYEVPDFTAGEIDLPYTLKNTLF